MLPFRPQNSHFNKINKLLLKFYFNQSCKQRTDQLFSIPFLHFLFLKTSDTHILYAHPFATNNIHNDERINKNWGTFTPQNSRVDKALLVPWQPNQALHMIPKEPPPEMITKYITRIITAHSWSWSPNKKKQRKIIFCFPSPSKNKTTTVRTYSTYSGYLSSNLFTNVYSNAQVF